MAKSDNRWKRWGEKGVFARSFAGLAAEEPEEKTVMIDGRCAAPCRLSNGSLPSGAATPTGSAKRCRTRG